MGMLFPKCVVEIALAVSISYSRNIILTTRRVTMKKMTSAMVLIGLLSNGNRLAAG